MVKRANSGAPRSVLPELAKLVDLDWTVNASRNHARRLVADVRKVAHEGSAIKIRIGRLLEEAAACDVSEGGLAGSASRSGCAHTRAGTEEKHRQMARAGR
jgi:hypothetical protein